MQLVRQHLEFSHFELLLLEAGSWGRGQFGNPEERKCPPLEAATKEQLVKAVTGWEEEVYPIVICEVCGTVRAQSLLVVSTCNSSINPITNPNPVYSHSIGWYSYTRNRGTVFSSRSVPRCYKRDKLGAAVREELVEAWVIWITAGVQSLWEADNWGRGQFGNPEEGECPPLEVVTKKRLLKTNRLRRPNVSYSDLWSVVTTCISGQ
jgi:hypothetical protein